MELVGRLSSLEKPHSLMLSQTKAGFIVVYPEGLALGGARTWNAGRCCGPNIDSRMAIDDVGFVSRLIDVLVDEYEVDAQRVYATGHSNGAMLTYRLMCELSEKIAAFVPNAGSDVYDEDCPGIIDRPLLHIHSKLDGNFAGRINGFGVETPSIESVLDEWSMRKGCDPARERFIDEVLFDAFRWNNCNSDVEVLYYLTEDGGHSWPGGMQLGEDPPSQAFNNNDLMWEFFERYTLN